MMRLLLAALVAAVTTMASPPSAGAADTTIRVGVLKFGTVNWELDAMKRAGLDEKHGIDVDIVPFAGEDATAVALQAGAVDVIVTDWLWVSRQRSEGSDLTFAPYSTSVGSIMVPPDGAVKTLADLKGKRIGVAGGPLDKNWLLIQALAKRETGLDLSREADVVYGAPPLLAEKIRQGELDAVLDFWNYAARLEAEGYRTLISGEDAAEALGTTGPVAAIGYVFHEGWAKEHPDLARGFVAASRETKALLKTSDAEWDALAPLVKPDNDRTLAVMRDRYREGIPERPIGEETADADRLYAILRKIGGERLVGKGETLAPGTYWSGLDNGS
ncbi:ABC transporter substrate-binding protein [Mangrovibrevibacter kandeliae]|uniref:ABC transporter substrate-binding protein n=1 Tax=Mangrovibrevibacter kandeliae TaxID=2968473 RepID=UPI002118DC67|nr:MULTISPECIES: ABC transporter substrate-binding protein [unclassified Aurantimonas]MCQ8781172.1 ABC transporter substrate-binding protein [Aurantimonas sp. CSK15Z-1]MCW4113949.1 ABC transporter substrate-binding protein [Aurantimonas sp. MSK8Z-1]